MKIYKIFKYGLLTAVVCFISAFTLTLDVSADELISYDADPSGFYEKEADAEPLSENIREFIIANALNLEKDLKDISAYRENMDKTVEDIPEDYSSFVNDSYYVYSEGLGYVDLRLLSAPKKVLYVNIPKNLVEQLEEINNMPAADFSDGLPVFEDTACTYHAWSAYDVTGFTKSDNFLHVKTTGIMKLCSICGATETFFAEEAKVSTEFHVFYPAAFIETLEEGIDTYYDKCIYCRQSGLIE